MYVYYKTPTASSQVSSDWIQFWNNFSFPAEFDVKSLIISFQYLILLPQRPLHGFIFSFSFPDFDTGPESPIDYFTHGRAGRLIGAVFHRESGMITPGACAQKCLNYDNNKCLSFNYDFSTETTCELLEAIEGFNFMVAKVGLFLFPSSMITCLSSA